MTKGELVKMLQANGMNRFDARRRVYGDTWKIATAPGRGVQRAITKAEKARRESMKYAVQEGQDHYDASQGQEAGDVSEGRASSQRWRSRRVEDSSVEDGSSEVR